MVGQTIGLECLQPGLLRAGVPIDQGIMRHTDSLLLGILCQHGELLSSSYQLVSIQVIQGLLLVGLIPIVEMQNRLG